MQANSPTIGVENKIVEIPGGMMKKVTLGSEGLQVPGSAEIDPTSFPDLPNLLGPSIQLGDVSF